MGNHRNEATKMALQTRAATETEPAAWTWEELGAFARRGTAPGERRPPPDPADLRLVVDCERWAAVGVGSLVGFPLLLECAGGEADAEDERLRRKLVATWSALRVFGPGCVKLDDDTRSLEAIFIAVRKAFKDDERGDGGLSPRGADGPSIPPKVE